MTAQPPPRGVFNPAWLTPELFELRAVQPCGEGCAELNKSLRSFQPWLSAIFMADLVKLVSGNYYVEYRGLGKSRFAITREELDGCAEEWGHLYELYRYACGERLADKLEIAQQFISLNTDSTLTLCKKARDFTVAAEATYGRTLVKKVEAYFAARQSVNERIQAAVGEVSNDAIGLSRDVGSDLYKIIGVMALAIAGALFRTDVGLMAVLVGLSAIAVYLLLVLAYHLPTLAKAADLRKDQHESYIKSFDDVLSEAEIEDFVDNNIWNAARTLFTEKRTQACVIYTILLIVSLLAAIGVGVLTYDLFWATPDVPPPKMSSAPSGGVSERTATGADPQETGGQGSQRV
jgi:hypothetical protein